MIIVYVVLFLLLAVLVALTIGIVSEIGAGVYRVNEREDEEQEMMRWARAAANGEKPGVQDDR